jgi:3-hydroxyisobutyrate dehydrogenase
MTSQMNIGIAGTGRMGTAIAGRLLMLGCRVTVWNRTPAKTAALAAAGAKVSATATQLAGACDIVLTILTNAAAVDAVYNDVSGLLAGEVAGKLFLEMSTVTPDSQRALAAKVYAKGAAMLDCPVGGTVGPAREGRLYAFIGGDTADVERARPLLDKMCRRIEHLGPIGAGATLKLAANLTTQVWWHTFGEALALCKPLHLPPERLMSIFLDTSGAPEVLRRRHPDIAAALAGNELKPAGFDIESVHKDVLTMLDAAKSQGCELPVTQCVADVLEQAVREGHGAADCTTLPAQWVSKAR